MALGTEKSQWVINFDAKGNHLPYDHDHRRDAHRMMPATYSFKGTLSFDSYERGRSAVTVWLRRSDDRKVSMSLAEFMRLVPTMVKGHLAGTWGFAKNGSNTTVMRVDG